MPSTTPDNASVDALVHAVTAGRVDDVRGLLGKHPELRSRLDDPLPGLPFDGVLLGAAVGKRNSEMIDLLLAAGADINARSRWWAGGFGVLDSCDPAFAPFLIERGARVDANAAARLGMLDTLERLIAADPAVVCARGGDGQTPLHVAASVDIARILLDHGADIDALDVDHESTPAQYLVRDHPEVARFLVERGCRTDILMAAALGDVERVAAHLEREPSSILTRVTEQYFPMRNARAGGHIYIWTLGAGKSPHLIAHELGHDDVFRLLMARSHDGIRLARACELGDEAMVSTLLERRAGLAETLPSEERRRLADVAEMGNTKAALLMLRAGWPVDVRGAHGATPLHFAAWRGNVELVRALLARGAPVDIRDDEYGGPPLGWAVYGSTNSPCRDRGDYPGVVEALLDVGMSLPSPLRVDDSEGSEAVRAVLRRRLNGG
jgi:ankyrin repeat protein